MSIAASQFQRTLSKGWWLYVVIGWLHAEDLLDSHQAGLFPKSLDSQKSRHMTDSSSFSWAHLPVSVDFDLFFLTYIPPSPAVSRMN